MQSVFCSEFIQKRWQQIKKHTISSGHWSRRTSRYHHAFHTALDTLFALSSVCSGRWCKLFNASYPYDVHEKCMSKKKMALWWFLINIDMLIPTICHACKPPPFAFPHALTYFRHTIQFLMCLHKYLRAENYITYIFSRVVHALFVTSVPRAGQTTSESKTLRKARH